MDEYKIIKDPEFGFLRLDPIPSSDVVEEFYREEFYSSKYAAFNDSAKENQDTEFNNLRFQDMLDVVAGKIGDLKGLSLFDVGCGYGELLTYCKNQGLVCAGTEVAPEAVEHTKSLGFDVSMSEIEKVFSEPGDKRYDIVTVFNVLEHLRNPAEVLTAIRENLLTKKGVLVIDVPNEFNPLQTVADAEHGLGQWWLAPPSHINYFSCDTLASTLEGTGYSVFDTISSFPMEMFLLMGDVYVGDGEIGAQCHKKRVTFEKTLWKHGKQSELRDLYRSFAKLNLGRQVVCYATPDPYSHSYPSIKARSK